MAQFGQQRLRLASQLRRHLHRNCVDDNLHDHCHHNRPHFLFEYFSRLDQTTHHGDQPGVNTERCRARGHGQWHRHSSGKRRRGRRCWRCLVGRRCCGCWSGRGRSCYWWWRIRRRRRGGPAFANGRRRAAAHHHGQGHFPQRLSQQDGRLRSHYPRCRHQLLHDQGRPPPAAADRPPPRAPAGPGHAEICRRHRGRCVPVQPRAGEQHGRQQQQPDGQPGHGGRLPPAGPAQRAGRGQQRPGPRWRAGHPAAGVRWRRAGRQPEPDGADDGGPGHGGGRVRRECEAWGVLPVRGETGRRARASTFCLFVFCLRPSGLVSGCHAGMALDGAFCMSRYLFLSVLFGSARVIYTAFLSLSSSFVYSK